MTVCINCGFDNIPSNRFCNRCGSKLENPPAGNLGEQPPIENNAQPEYVNPGMGQMQQYQQPPYPPQQYPPQPYGQYPAPAPYMQPPAPMWDYNNIVVRLSQREREQLQAYAQFNNIPMEEFIRKAAMEKLNEEFDKKSADIAYKAFMDNPGTYTLEEVMQNYDL